MLNLSEYRHKIELHAHTSPVSRCSEIPPAELVQNYHALGCEAVAITNHFTPALLEYPSREEALAFYMRDFAAAKAEGDRLGVRVLLGFELRFTESSNDYLLFGADESDAAAIYDHLGDGAEYFARSLKKPSQFFLQAHPFRSGMTLLDPALLDGVESFNVHPGHNSRVAVAAKYAHEHHLIETCGTDYHHPGHQGLGLTLTKTLPGDTFELAALLHSGDFLFEIGGDVVIPARLRT